MAEPPVSPALASLGLDRRDAAILSAFMQDPFVSQTRLARALRLSQPSVNARLHKLRQKGLLRFQAGLGFEASGLTLCRVDFTAKDAKAVLDYLKACTFFVNGFIMSGLHNVSVFLVTESLNKLEEIVNTYIRRNPDVSDVNVSVVVGVARPLLLNLVLDEKHDRSRCPAPHACRVCTILPVNIKKHAPRA